MKQNRICQLFDIEYPIIQAGMVWCSGWKLASAVSKIGGLGLIGAGSMTPDILREHIRKCKAATNKPFGVNLPLLYSDVEKQLDILIQEGVKIVFTSAGNPKIWTPLLKEKNIIVVHVVSSKKFALKAEEAGVDAVVAEGFEAGGHNGREETTTFCLVPMVKEAITIPLIAAGGIGSGRSMLAAMVLGADGVQIGSRFATSTESSAHENFKRKIIEAEEGDTILTLKQLTPVRFLKNKFYETIQAAESSGASSEELKMILGKGRSRKGIFEGDLEEGELEIGQIAATLKKIESAEDIVKNIWDEYVTLKKEFSQGSF
ncbi:MAG TPA: nitronate monooxygenase [Cytophagaceae bacterium]|jgi:enoyl-[acyl-carrier protein] reductase II|nr:nitronate monooxygenase [Cytophagaceae bacterium]